MLPSDIWVRFRVVRGGREDPSPLSLGRWECERERWECRDEALDRVSSRTWMSLCVFLCFNRA
jgi:hypothetical protein